MEAQTLAGCLALGTTQPQGPPRPAEDPDLRSAENTTLSLIRPGSLSPPCSCDHHIRCQECPTLPICPANTTCVKAQLKRDMLRDALQPGWALECHSRSHTLITSQPSPSGLRARRGQGSLLLVPASHQCPAHRWPTSHQMCPLGCET